MHDKLIKCYMRTVELEREFSVALKYCVYMTINLAVDEFISYVIVVC